jgi:hypothetical protein
MTKESLPGISNFEYGLKLIDDTPWGAFYRMAIGYWTQPLYSRFVGETAPGWCLWIWFLTVLMTLRLVPAIVRAVLPFSERISAIWADRRRMAKRFDSYQWRKLTWFGVGLAVYALWSGSVAQGGIPLAVSCLVGGGLGELAWQRRQENHV